MLPLPKTCYMNMEKKVSVLHFDKPHKDMDGEYYMKGGLCWPIPVRFGADHGASGFILMAGQNIETKKIYIFKQTSFLSIENIFDSQGKMEIEGLSGFFNKCWSEYFGKNFYYHQDESTHKMFLLKALRSKIILPKPAFIEIEWENSANMEALIWRLGNTGILKFEKDSELHKALNLFEIQTDHRDTLPAVYALKCLLCGLECYPWRKRKK